MRTAIERLLGDAELRRTLGAAGRRRIDEDLTTRHMAARWLPVLEAAA
jgi:glycosyltransferase involved in cell wall biosynthesis